MTSRPIAKLGRSVMVNAIGLQENRKYVEYDVSVNHSVCQAEKCHHYSSKALLSDGIREQFEERHCHLFCTYPDALTKTPRNLYENEKHQYKIASVHKRLSRLELLLLIYLHFHVVEGDGIVRNISLKGTSKALCCDIRSVRNCFESLSEMGYILRSDFFDGKVNAILRDYKSYHLPAREGGSGYFSMSKETFFEIVQVKSVNSIRLLIRFFMEYSLVNADKDLTAGASFNPVEIDYRQMRQWLPKYIKSNRMIREFLNEVSGLLALDKTETGVKVDLKRRHNPAYRSAWYKSSFAKYFTNELKNALFPEDKIEKAVEDLIQLSFQYDFAPVSRSLVSVFNSFLGKEETIETLGALVRRGIRYSREQVA